MPFEVALSDLAEPPCYQKVTKEAVHLYRLGMNANRIASVLKVDRTTAVRALRWIKATPFIERQFSIVSTCQCATECPYNS